MYSPPYNRLEDRAELIAFLRANNFPLLVTGLGGNLHASHLPAMIREEGEREMDLVARRGRAAGVVRHLVRPLRQRVRRFCRRPQREEQAH